MKEAMLLAAEAEGSDGKGKGKLVGYLRDLARNHKTVFGPMLGRLIAVDVNASLESSHEKALEELERLAKGGA